MKMEITLLVLFLMFNFSNCVIYELNDTMYYKMPPIFHLDDYGSCLGDPGGVYCFTQFDLVSDTPSELLNMIHNFSDHHVKHYNHTKLRYGICATQSCKNYYNDVRNKEELRAVLEACQNHTFENKYKLKTRINTLHCNTEEDQIEIGYPEYVVAAVCIVLLMINIIGSCYDVNHVRKGKEKGNNYLLAFSLKQNWAKLVADDISFEDMKRFTAFNGMRTILIILVISVHSALQFFIIPHSVRNIESIYDNMFYQVFLNGTPIIQVFFIITGFLLGYKTRQQSEKISLTLKIIPKLIFLRWIRLVPVYAFVLAIISTWHRIAWTGPLWHLAVIEEAEHCRQKFWQNLLFINNYFDNTQCMPQTWYVSADTQLYCLGIILCVVLKTDASRKVVISFLMVAGVVIQGIVTYVMDLDGALLVYPDSIINFFINDPTFNNMYKRGHTNLSSFIIGLGMGFLVYHLIKNNFNVQNYKKYFWLYKYLIPSFVALSLLSSVFFRDAPRYPIYVRIAYVLLIKPMFTIILALFLLGLILRFDELYCGIMESKYWTITGRLSYSTYLVHAILIRSCLGSYETLLSSYFIHLISHCVSMVVGSFLLAIPVWLLIEAPCSQLVRLIFTGKTIPMGRKRLTYVKLRRQMTNRKH